MPYQQRNKKGQFKKNNKFNKKSLESQESDAESNYKLFLGRGYFVFSASTAGNIHIH
jgi:hypothetical protein